MVRLFIRLKVRSSFNRIRQLGFAGWLTAGLQTLLVLSMGIGGAVVLGATRWSTTPGETRLYLVFAMVFLSWLMPAMNVQADNADLAMSRFSSFPLRAHDKAVGLLAARAFGFPALATALVLLGGLVGYVPVGPGAGLVVVAVAVQGVFCIVVARALAGVFEVLAQTRRARDILVVVSGALIVGTYLSINRLSRSSASAAPLTEAAAGWGIVFPPYALARAVLLARGGEVVVPALAIAYTAAMAYGAWRLWCWALASEGRMREPHTRVRRTGGLLALYPLGWRYLPKNRLGVVAARELRYYFFRKPDHLMSIAWFIVYPFLIGGGQAFKSSSPVAASFTGLWMAFLLGFTTMGMFQLDGQAVWLQAVASGRARADVHAKAAVRALLLAVPLFAISAFAAYSVHDVTPVVAGLPMAFGLYALLFGTGSVLAVRSPGSKSATGETRRVDLNPVGCLLFVVQFLLIIPGVALVAGLYAMLGSLIPGAWAAGVYGLVVGGLFLRYAGRSYEQHLPEFLEHLRVEA